MYLWKFGPTAGLTLTAVLWSRVELQAMRYMPWMCAKAGQVLGREEYEMDYTQKLFPSVLSQSLRRRHYIVFFATTISIILKGQIILAPGLFRSATVNVSRATNVRVFNSFRTDDDLEVRSDKGAWYNARAIQDFGMEFPYGVTSDLAYQSFVPADQTGNVRASVDRPMKAVVDASFVITECRQMVNFSTTSRAAEGRVEGYYDVTILAQFDTCEEPVTIENSGLMSGARYWVSNKELKNSQPCSSLPQQHPQFVYFSGMCEETNNSVPRLVNCGAVICTSIAWLSKVEIIDDGINPNVSLLSDGDSLPLKTNPWAVLSQSIPAENGDMSGKSVGRMGRVIGPLKAMSYFDQKTLDPDDVSLYRSDLLEQAVTNLTQRLGPMLSHTVFRKGDDSQIIGQTLGKTERLHMSEVVCLIMMGLFILVSTLVICILVQINNVKQVWKRDPATILGLMAFFGSNTWAVHGIPESSTDTRNAIKAQWIHCDFSPLSLKPWFRVCSALYGVGLMIALVYLLQVSKTSDGLATIDERNTYSVLMWKSLPTYDQFPALEDFLWDVLEQLVEEVHHVFPSTPIGDVVNKCIDLFFQFLFPSAPICHEPSLRRAAGLFFRNADSQRRSSLADAAASMLWKAPGIDAVRSFTLLTAVCASTLFFHQDAFLHVGRELGQSFLRASRRMLKEYEDFDVQWPDSSSLAIRSLVSGALQQQTGSVKLAWHILGQAGILARTLRFYNEHVLQEYPPLESKLMRHNFWALYTADQAAITLGNRAVSLAGPLFQGEMDLKDSDENNVSLLDASKEQHQGPFESVTVKGYHLIRRGWQIAARMILCLRSHKDTPVAGITTSTQNQLQDSWLELCGLLYDMPEALRNPDQVISGSAVASAYQITCCQAQRFNILVMFHCSKTLVLHQAVESGLGQVLGLSEDVTAQSMMETNLASDFIQVLQGASERVLHNRGEPFIELIRAIGAILIAISVRCPNTKVYQRSKSLLDSLLNVLAKLDSPALHEFSRRVENEPQVPASSMIDTGGQTW
ncbi:hypothetical protein HJFPF1_00143 [Paramyrothecium foliicola]|nr:hypothetical protein HJFPF1_00143 [Paramyrothecium foliicola]